MIDTDVDLVESQLRSSFYFAKYGWAPWPESIYMS